MIDAIISAHFQLNPHPVKSIDNKVVDFFIGTDKTIKNLNILLKLIYKTIFKNLTYRQTSKKKYLLPLCFSALVISANLNPQTLNFTNFKKDFLNGYLAALQPTLSHCRGGSITNPMLITALDS